MNNREKLMRAVAGPQDGNSPVVGRTVPIVPGQRTRTNDPLGPSSPGADHKNRNCDPLQHDAVAAAVIGEALQN